MLTHLSLFSGIGGLDLAAEWAGFETVGQCEWADYPTKILEKHWPDVPRWRDIRELTGESFYERTSRKTVDIVSGGFPCQPFSVAGKQKGKGDDRYLWPEMLRVITELKPRWVVGENVPGILRIAATDVVTDLERAGYHVVVFDFEAAAVGALHRRERVAFVANTGSVGLHWHRAKRKQERGTRQETWKPERRGDVSNSYGGEALRRSPCCAGIGQAPGSGENHFGGKKEHEKWEWWSVEPGLGRVANGIPNRVDRLKCLGNAVVPQQFYPIFRAIAECEGGEKDENSI